MTTLLDRRSLPARRSQHVVNLRSAMPVQLLTLRHDIPKFLASDVDAQETVTTPQVPLTQVSIRETAARKGRQAQ